MGGRRVEVAVDKHGKPLNQAKSNNQTGSSFQKQGNQCGVSTIKTRTALFTSNMSFVLPACVPGLKVKTGERRSVFSLLVV